MNEIKDQNFINSAQSSSDLKDRWTSTTLNLNPLYDIICHKKWHVNYPLNAISSLGSSGVPSLKTLLDVKLKVHTLWGIHT